MGKQLKFQWGWDVPPPIDYKLYIKKLKTKKNGIQNTNLHNHKS